MTDVKKACVLITGGSEGIGYGLAARFIQAGSRVMITGRNAGKLQAAAQNLAGLQTCQNDISDPAQRENLAAHIQQTMPGINVVINNAGIQRRVALAADNAPWPGRQAEIDTLLSAPVHLNHLLMPLLLANSGVIVNVTSGGAYIPQVFAPVYSACKAALHSYTMVLRHSLQQTDCRVVELIPPAVQTTLAGPGLNHGVALDIYCDDVFARLIQGDEDEIGYGPTNNLSVEISGKPIKTLFENSAERFEVERY